MIGFYFLNEDIIKEDKELKEIIKKIEEEEEDNAESTD